MMDKHYMPTSLIKACQAKVRSLDSDASASPLFGVGRRDSDFASLAGFLRSKGANEAVIMGAMTAIDRLLPVPHGQENLARISGSIARYSVKPDTFTQNRFANYLAEALMGQILYCEHRGWFVFRDGYWQRDAEGNRVLDNVRSVVNQVRADILSMRSGMDDKEYERLMKAATKMETLSFMQGSMKLLQSDPSFAFQYDDFNPKTDLLNLANGALSLKSLELLQHSPDHKLNYKLPVVYDPKAQCPNFDKFLAEILEPDVRAFVMRVIGYALLGHAAEQKLFIMVGKGKNGKSTLMDVFSKLFGELAITVQPESLGAKSEGGIRNDLARIEGTRMMLTSEMRAGTVLGADIIKRLTGNDTITARYLYKEHFQFKSEAVPFLVANYLPVIDGGDFAMNRRFSVIKFRTVIKEADLHLTSKLDAELSGIFNRVLEGMQDYKANGLSVPASVVSDTSGFLDRSNLMKSFFEETFDEVDGEKVRAGAMYRTYENWCKDNGYKPMSNNMFRDAFERATNIEPKRDSAGNYWPALRLRLSSV